MIKAQKLELTWFGKNDQLLIEPRILVEDVKNSNSINISSNLDSNAKDCTDNILIHGDNLLALKALENEYSSKVKCVYIDPPYNTGSAFDLYDDNLEHSIWLSLMRPRLEILRRLIRDDGSIFVQIDDNEQAYLKVLMDEIFGRSNFISTICVKMSTLSGVKTTHKYKTIIKEKEMILVYAKNVKNFTIKPQYIPVKEWDNEFQYYLDKQNSNDPDNWKILKLKDVLIHENIEFNPNNDLFWNFVQNNSDKIWRRAFIRNEYKLLSQENPDTIFYINKENKEHYYYRGREMFFLRDKYNLCLTESGYQNTISNLLGDIWLDINTGKLFNEGGIEFRNSKKPEFLIARILDMASIEGDIVLDSFLGSGTTAAVAHKMKRKWIGIEMGDHAYSLCKPRLDSVINNNDQGGVSIAFDWKGGGGYKFYELSQTLVKIDDFGQPIINPEYNAELLASAVSKHEGYVLIPSHDLYWKQAYSEVNSFLFVTTRHVTKLILESIHNSMKNNEFLLIVCKSFDTNAESEYTNIRMKKIPQSLLKNCEFGIENYNLNIVSPPNYIEDEDGQERRL